MLNYTLSTTDQDLHGILKLQKSNLAQSLTADEMRKEGFVTVIHSYADLKRLNDIEKHIIAKDGDKVVAYLLAMTQRSGNDIPVLVPMFELFEEITYEHKRISTYDYIVVGQVCIDKQYRGQGILDNCYKAYRDHFSEKYAFAITEIAIANQRSINAHKRIGFKEIHKYSSLDNTEWSIVLWDWKGNI
jgi:GNAT superfamily N-acetyltransferase